MLFGWNALWRLRRQPAISGSSWSAMESKDNVSHTSKTKYLYHQNEWLHHAISFRCLFDIFINLFACLYLMHVGICSYLGRFVLLKNILQRCANISNMKNWYVHCCEWMFYMQKNYWATLRVLSFAFMGWNTILNVSLVNVLENWEWRYC